MTEAKRKRIGEVRKYYNDTWILMNPDGSINDAPLFKEEWLACRAAVLDVWPDAKYSEASGWIKAINGKTSGVLSAADSFLRRTEAWISAYKRLKAEDEQQILDVCGSAKAPKGWSCTRAVGHEGPCAAIQIPIPSEDEQGENCDWVVPGDTHSPQCPMSSKPQEPAQEAPSHHESDSSMVEDQEAFAGEEVKPSDVYLRLARKHFRETPLCHPGDEQVEANIVDPFYVSIYAELLQVKDKLAKNQNRTSWLDESTSAEVKLPELNVTQEDRDRAYKEYPSRSGYNERRFCLNWVIRERQLLEAKKDIARLSGKLSACTTHPSGCAYWRERSKESEAQSREIECNKGAAILDLESALVQRDEAREIVESLENYGFDVYSAGLGMNGKICHWYVGYKQIQTENGFTLDVRSPENTTVGHADTLLEAVRNAVGLAWMKGESK